MTTNFSYLEYKIILEAFKGKWAMFHEVTDKPFALMRHDVEFSVNRAYSMGKIEAENSVKSTFNFQVCGETYNIASKSNREKIRELNKIGHEIGLHLYVNSSDRECLDDLISNLHKQRDLLETAVDMQISTFSFHRPKEWLLKIRDDEIGGMLNQYGQSFFEFSDEPKNIKYLADSRHSWDYGHPLDYKHMDFLQILTHPDEWTIEGQNVEDNFKSLKAELSENISKVFLAESPRNFSTYKNKI